MKCLDSRVLRERTATGGNAGTMQVLQGLRRQRPLRAAHGRRRDRCKDCRCARAAADAQEKLPGKLRPQLAQPYAFQSVAQGALRLSTCTAAADAQEKAAAALAAVAALEGETAGRQRQRRSVSSVQLSVLIKKGGFA